MSPSNEDNVSKSQEEAHGQEHVSSPDVPAKNSSVSYFNLLTATKLIIRSRQNSSSSILSDASPPTYASNSRADTPGR